MRQKFKILKSHHVTVQKLLYHCPFLNSERKLEKRNYTILLFVFHELHLFRVCSYCALFVMTLFFHQNAMEFQNVQYSVRMIGCIYILYKWYSSTYSHLQIYNLSNFFWHMAGINLEFLICTIC